MDWHDWWKDPERHERVEVTAYPEEWYHLHGKALSGLRHSHPLRDGESPDEPDHEHEGEYTLPWDHPEDRRGIGAALYPATCETCGHTTADGHRHMGN